MYRAEVPGDAGQEAVRAAAEGIELDDGSASPAALTVLSAGDEGSIVELVVHEGKKRQVRRMLFALGHPVRHLERMSFAGITAKGLATGSCRELTEEEIARLTVVAGMHTTGETT